MDNEYEITLRVKTNSSRLEDIEKSVVNAILAESCIITAVKDINVSKIETKVKETHICNCWSCDQLRYIGLYFCFKCHAAGCEAPPTFTRILAKCGGKNETKR